MGYHKTQNYTDKISANKKGGRKKILKTFDDMLARCIGEGKNPYTVNVITFSGHGITVNGDAVAVIPDSNSARFINMSGIARKFAAKKCTFNLFICSMCRE